MAGHVDGRQGLREDRGRAGVGGPAVVTRAVAGERRFGFLGIADAVDVEREADLLRGAEQEVLQLLGPLAVAPIADPDETFALLLHIGRVEEAGVGGFVPGPDVAPAPAAIDFG